MDDPFQDLEAELRQLRPRTPSAGLLARVGEDLAGPEATRAARPVRRWQFLPVGAPRWLVWPVAAALLAFGGILAVYLGRAGGPRSTAPVVRAPAFPEPATAAFKPVGATKFLYESLDAGPVLLSDGRPARRVCNRYVDTYTWQDPRTRASVQWIIPRAEVRLVPVEAF